MFNFQIHESTSDTNMTSTPFETKHHSNPKLHGQKEIHFRSHQQNTPSVPPNPDQQLYTEMPETHMQPTYRSAKEKKKNSTKENCDKHEMGDRR